GDIQGTTGYTGDPYGLPEGSSGGSGGLLPEIPPFGVGKDYVPPTSSARVWPLIWVDNYWVYSKKGSHGMSQNEFSGRLAIPLSLLGTLEHPIYFVPGGKITWFDGPDVGGPHELYGNSGEPLGMYYPPGNLPGALYEVYGGFNWTPKIGENLSFDLTIAPWLGTDRFSPRWAIKGGVYYTDRDRYDWVPGLGLIWNPGGDESLQLDLYYPDAGVLWKPDNGNLWFRLHGMYGGGRWTWEEPGDGWDQVDVGDLRLLATCGIGEYATAPRFSVTLGWAFDREIRYRNRPERNMKLKDGFVV
ncbi:MAG: hypothetical protein Q4C47_09185, partial [Planctomycetia bacterium]|nr:hypothetical protein [Planctomycetia bacterium]